MTPDHAVLTDRPPSPIEPAFLPLQARPDVVRPARHFTTAAVAGHPYDAYEIALLTSELTTNAVRAATALHPWPDDMWPIAVEVTVTDRYVHLAVTDPDPRPLPELEEPGPEAENGRGLFIVDAHVTRRWVAYTEHGKTVHVLIIAPGVTLTKAELKEIGVPR